MKAYLFVAMLVMVAAGGVGLASNAAAVDDADEISAPIERTALVQIEVLDLTIAKHNLMSHGPKLERYLRQLADGAITEQEFHGYILDLDALTELDSLKQQVACSCHARRASTLTLSEKTPKLAVLNPMEPQARIVASTRGYSYPLRC